MSTRTLELSRDRNDETEVRLNETVPGFVGPISSTHPASEVLLLFRAQDWKCLDLSNVRAESLVAIHSGGRPGI